MDWLAPSLDVLFLFLALLIFPASRYMTPPPPLTGDPTSPPTTHGPHGQHNPYLSLPGRSTQSTPSGSPLVSPIPDMSDRGRHVGFAVPTITITPDRNLLRPGHKRKSVSFSLTSIDDLNIDNPNNNNARKRPPTPFVSGPVSPSQRIAEEESPAPSMPGTPATSLFHNVQAIDPMGVQKKWLMA